LDASFLMCAFSHCSRFFHRTQSVTWILTEFCAIMRARNLCANYS
jgi:hypothetical protein